MGCRGCVWLKHRIIYSKNSIEMVCEISFFPSISSSITGTLVRCPYVVVVMEIYAILRLLSVNASLSYLRCCEASNGTIVAGRPAEVSPTVPIITTAPKEKSGVRMIATRPRSSTVTTYTICILNLTSQYLAILLTDNT